MTTTNHQTNDLAIGVTITIEIHDWEGDTQPHIPPSQRGKRYTLPVYYTDQLGPFVLPTGVNVAPDHWGEVRWLIDPMKGSVAKKGYIAEGYEALQQALGEDRLRAIRRRSWSVDLPKFLDGRVGLPRRAMPRMLEILEQQYQEITAPRFASDAPENRPFATSWDSELVYKRAFEAY
jgi:hypothetical protein